MVCVEHYALTLKLHMEHVCFVWNEQEKCLTECLQVKVDG